MENIFEEFKSGKRTDIYIKDSLFNKDYMVYAKFKEERDGGMVFDTQAIGLKNGCFSFEEGEATFREMNEEEISAELFYEAYDVYVKYESCVDALTEIFNKL